ncbi:hypothetical protein ACTJJ7_05595, partial [Phyllobacterium sp. 22229]
MPSVPASPRRRCSSVPSARSCRKPATERSRRFEEGSARPAGDRPQRERPAGGYAGGDKPRSYAPRPPRGDDERAERPKRSFGSDRPEGSRDGPRPPRPPRVGKRERAELKEREAAGGKPSHQSERPNRAERPYGTSGRPTRQDGRSGDRPYGGPKGAAPRGAPSSAPKGPRGGSGGGAGRPPRKPKP